MPPRIAEVLDEPESKKPSGPVTIVLSEPIEFGKQTITELTVRPAKAKDLRGLPPIEAKLDWSLALAGRLTGQPNAVIDKLGMDDLSEVLKVVSDFTPGSQSTGSEP